MWNSEDLPESSAPRTERRKRRSNDPVTALHYQLAATRGDARLEALVLVDGTGCLVAGAGSWPVCEELAAYAPLLAHPEVVENDTLETRVSAIGAEVDVRSFQVHGAEVLLCAVGGGPERPSYLALAAAGCRRILTLAG